jgi:hypothetical protein
MLGTDAKSLCAMCHTDDKGAAAAVEMRAQVERLKAALQRSGATVTSLKNSGMEMSAQELTIGAARTQLTVVRTELHAFDAARIGSVVGEALKTLGEVDAAGERATAELRFRRRGLALSLGAILLVVVALAFKIRQLGRHDQTRGHLTNP